HGHAQGARVDLAPGSRKNEPQERIEVGENPTECHHCGSRTDLIGVTHDGFNLEARKGCGQLFIVEDEIEDIGAEANGYLDVIEHEQELAVVEDEASQADLGHLFDIPPSPYPDFGSY
ncbi:MAG: hypothetical protein WKG03_16690, partial [Telluria sp.]